MADTNMVKKLNKKKRKQTVILVRLLTIGLLRFSMLVLCHANIYPLLACYACDP